MEPSDLEILAAARRRFGDVPAMYFRVVTRYRVRYCVGIVVDGPHDGADQFGIRCSADSPTLLLAKLENPALLHDRIFAFG
jgi:hypothetical protein